VFVVQLRHKALEDVERRQPTHACAVERQQAKAGGVERAGDAAGLGRKALRHRGFYRWTVIWWSFSIQGQVKVGRTERVHGGRVFFL
jgi:hypothetical protein